MQHRPNLILILFLMLATATSAQKKFPEHRDNEGYADSAHLGSALLLHLAYGTHLPSHDLAKRFGWANTFGGGLEWMMKNNFSVGIDGHYLYGQKVNEDVLAPIRTDSGFVVGNNQTEAQVVLRQRGQYIGGQLGKLFIFDGAHRAGLKIALGVGVLRHKIRVQDDARTLTQITGEYAKGYDRLTGGLALNQFIGYQFMGKTRSINFFAGLEFNQGFTRSLRDWDFAAGKKLEGTRKDFRWGVRVGWTLPFYFRKSQSIYY